MTARCDLWNLRTFPFYPEKDGSGRPIEKKALVKSLDPLTDEAVLPLYYDLYDWTASRLIGGLSPNGGLGTFPTEQILSSDTPLLVIASGAGQTGLDSLANLILYKIKATSGQQPLLCDIPLESRDQRRNLEAVAKAIIDTVEFAKPPIKGADEMVQRMNAKLDREMASVERGGDVSYANVFRAFGMIMSDVDRKLVIRITRGGDSDSWGRIQEAIGSLAGYIIVTTGDAIYAKSCYESCMAYGRNVAWIKAGPLDEQKARDYVRSRVAAERIDPASASADDDLHPFTDEAIGVLYRRGTSAVEAPRHAVGWLRRTLHEAFVDRLNAMSQPPGAPAVPPDPAALPRIGPDEVKAAREKLNWGG